MFINARHNIVNIQLCFTPICNQLDVCFFFFILCEIVAGKTEQSANRCAQRKHDYNWRVCSSVNLFLLFGFDSHLLHKCLLT